MGIKTKLIVPSIKRNLKFDKEHAEHKEQSEGEGAIRRREDGTISLCPLHSEQQTWREGTGGRSS